MQNKSNKPDTLWSSNITVSILCFYLFFILPVTNIFFRTNPWLFKYSDIIYFFAVVLFALYRLNVNALGFPTKHLKQHLVVGIISGGILLLSLPLLDFGIDLTGLADHELFANRPKNNILDNLYSLAEYTLVISLIPLIEQIFFTGIIFQSLLKKINPILAIYASGVIYTLAGFKLSLGTFGLGITTSFLFKITGSLYASILFHMSCATGGVLLKNVYPRLTTILGFLF